MHRPCAIVPVYNHEHAVGRVVAALRAAGLPVILVDDGSSAACAQVLDALASGDDIELLRHSHNQGKGAAVLYGLRHAFERGYTHALQLDADGQHDVADVPKFLRLSATHPDSIICGVPIFDETVPKERLYGRYLTHVFVWIVTLSLRIRDSMCGFRLYPLAESMHVIQHAPIGRHMDFDSSIIVRLDWAGVPILTVPTRVHYPQDGVSHYRLWCDNLLMVWQGVRLLIGMLPRLPMLLWRVVTGRAGERTA
ncbi:glycosyltransferase family 2 protein [Andreprevotia chitinilytica]|uniref:glycosyltransferase family 2 protein n=1 Tax=Andreprevotia chitinilytica TaxID=396808 RepID=UPI00068DD825|nr:glycosyltransferase family 2 protein [Andreprevotia chitinilytica]